MRYAGPLIIFTLAVTFGCVRDHKKNNDISAFTKDRIKIELRINDGRKFFASPVVKNIKSRLLCDRYRTEEDIRSEYNIDKIHKGCKIQIVSFENMNDEMRIEGEGSLDTGGSIIYSSDSRKEARLKIVSQLPQDFKDPNIKTYAASFELQSD
ncbi:MAG: hypothetical protein HQK54_07165 [Oligoflexales bacterium]|nr:hypothetical protein [Oligoflexales bacterium]